MKPTNNTARDLFCYGYDVDQTQMSSESALLFERLARRRLYWYSDHDRLIDIWYLDWSVRLKSTSWSRIRETLALPIIAFFFLESLSSKRASGISSTTSQLEALCQDAPDVESESGEVWDAIPLVVEGTLTLFAFISYASKPPRFIFSSSRYSYVMTYQVPLRSASAWVKLVVQRSRKWVL